MTVSAAAFHQAGVRELEPQTLEAMLIENADNRSKKVREMLECRLRMNELRGDLHASSNRSLGGQPGIDLPEKCLLYVMCRVVHLRQMTDLA